VVIPELNTVVVFTGGNYTTGVTTQAVLERCVLASIDKETNQSSS